MCTNLSIPRSSLSIFACRPAIISCLLSCFLTQCEIVKKKRVVSFLIVLVLPSAHLSPLGVEAQSPPTAAGHRSLCPWRRQPTYCQLALKWRTFHHPTKNTIKNVKAAVGGPQEPPPVVSLVTLSLPHPLRYLLPVWLSVCQLRWNAT